MAITREQLKEMGLEDEQVTKVLNAHHAEMAEMKEKAEGYDSEKARADKLKADFDNQAEQIKKLTESNNSEELKKQIEKLTAEAESKDAEHKKQLEEMTAKLDTAEFDKVLDSVLISSKAKRKKAVIAELDMDTLRQSKNREADIKKAIEGLKENEDTAFLFGEEEAKPTGEKVSFPGSTSKSSDSSETDIARAVMGLTPEKEK